MTANELIDLVKKRIEHCQRYPEVAHIEARVPMKMPAPKSWRYQWRRRAKTPFGMCEAYPANDGVHILIYPTIEQVTSWIARNWKQKEPPR